MQLQTWAAPIWCQEEHARARCQLAPSFCSPSISYRRHTLGAEAGGRGGRTDGRPHSFLFKEQAVTEQGVALSSSPAFKTSHGIIYLPHVQQTTLPPSPTNIHINADSQLKWLQIKAESVIIERVLSWMTIKRHLIRGLPKRSSKTTISMHSVMDIMDNYPECTTQPHSCLQLHPQQLPPLLHPLSSPVTSSYSFPRELVVSS